MKKLLLSLLTLCLVFSLAACGEDGKKTSDKESEKKTERDSDDNKDSKDDKDSADFLDSLKEKVTEINPDEPSQEIIDASWDSGLIQVDGKLVQFPFTLSDWVAMGFDYDLGELNKDYLYAQNQRGHVSLLVNGEEFIICSFIKTTEDYETVESINPLVEETGLLMKAPKNFSVFFPGGLTFGDPYQNIEAALGAPREGYTYGEFSYGIKYGLSFSINRNEQTINTIQLGKNLKPCPIEDLTTITFENVPNRQTSDMHNVSLSWFPESQEPTDALSLKDQRGGRSVMIYNNQTYFAEFVFSLTSQKYAKSNEYSSYGDPLFDETDENGMHRRLFKAEDNYLVVCSTDAFILKSTLKLKNAMDDSEDTYAVLKDFAIEFTKSIQY